MRVPAILFSASIFTLVACGGDEPQPKTPESTNTATMTSASAEPPPAAAGSAEPVASAAPPKEEPKPAPPPKKTAKEIITGGGTFMFSLADSADAKKLSDEDCVKKGGAKKDEKKIEACKKDAETAAAGEGIRFEKDDKGDWWWVSFGSEKGKEVVYNKVKFTVASEADGKITLTPAGKDLGKKPMKTVPKEVVVDVPDESTVSMTDPKKGKLVYKKK